MWLKKQDKVVVLRGKEKGKRGEILRASGKELFIVSKLNIIKRHQKPRKDEVGGIIEKEAGMHQSKLMLICPKCDSETRPKFSRSDEGDRIRICRKCSEMI